MRAAAIVAAVIWLCSMAFMAVVVYEVRQEIAETDRRIK
jgi:cell division protein FtsL